MGNPSDRGLRSSDSQSSRWPQVHCPTHDAYYGLENTDRLLLANPKQLFMNKYSRCSAEPSRFERILVTRSQPQLRQQQRQQQTSLTTTSNPLASQCAHQLSISQASVALISPRAYNSIQSLCCWWPAFVCAHLRGLRPKAQYHRLVSLRACRMGLVLVVLKEAAPVYVSRSWIPRRPSLGYSLRLLVISCDDQRTINRADSNEQHLCPFLFSARLSRRDLLCFLVLELVIRELPMWSSAWPNRGRAHIRQSEDLKVTARAGLRIS